MKGLGAREVVGCFREIRAECAAVGVEDYDHEAAARASELVAEAVEGGESAAVLFERIDEGPVVHNLEAWWE